MQARTYLAIPDVYAHNRCNSPLQEAIREAASGDAGVKSMKTLDFYLEMIKCSLQLFPCPTGEGSRNHGIK